MSKLYLANNTMISLTPGTELLVTPFGQPFYTVKVEAVMRMGTETLVKLENGITFEESASKVCDGVWHICPEGTALTLTSQRPLQ